MRQMTWTGIIAAACLLWTGAAAAEWIAADPAQSGEPRPASFQRLEADADATTLRLEVAGLWSTPVRDAGFDAVSLGLPGAATLRELGQPALPTAAQLLAVPADAPLWVEVLDVDVVWIDSPPPAPAMPLETRLGPQPVAWQLDEALYDSAATWPAEWAVIEGPWMLRQLPVARLELRVARYDFERGKLGLLRGATVRVHHDGGAVLDASQIDSVAFAQLYDQSMFHYELPDSGVNAVPETMLVIVQDDLADAIDPLVQWKRQRGMQVTVRTLGDVGSATADVQDAITEAYEGWDPPLTYVLLVGDDAPFYRGTYDDCASDYMFTQLEGGDLLADVMISRIVGATDDDVAVQVQKILGYEKTPPLGDDAEWIRKAMGAACNESGGGPTDDERFDRIAEVLDAHGYSHIDKLYVVTGNGTNAEVKTALNDGRGWAVYLGHGSGYDWSSLMPPFSVSDANSLTNEGMWPLVTDCSCLNGGFDGADDCLTEAFMKHGSPDNPLGALGVYASSTSTSWDPAGDIAEGVTYGFLDHGHAYWGGSVLYAMTYVIENWGEGMDSEWLFQQWVLFGDASLMVRSRPPIEAEISYPTGFPMNEAEFVVEVTTGGSPFAGAIVALHKDGEWDEVALTDSDGKATFTLSPAEKGAMEVVVTGRDLAPHIGTSTAGALPGLGGGCGAFNPFSYNPAPTGFVSSIATPAAGAPLAVLLLLIGAAVVRRTRW